MNEGEESRRQNQNENEIVGTENIGRRKEAG